jgi:hypothetical protein
MGKTIALLIGLVAALAGCNSTVENVDDYYLTRPAEKSFHYAVRGPDGSEIEGTIVLDVKKIHFPADRSGDYGAEFALEKKISGELETRDAAVAWAPVDDLKKALDPARHGEIFQQLAPNATLVKRNLIRKEDLTLPIRFKEETGFSGSTTLSGSRENVDEVSLVWIKIVLNELHLPGGIRIERLGLFEQEGSLTLIQGFSLPGQDEDRYLGTFVSRFQKHGGLTSLQGTLPDGTVVHLVQTGRRPSAPPKQP